MLRNITKFKKYGLLLVLTLILLIAMTGCSKSVKSFYLKYDKYTLEETVGTTEVYTSTEGDKITIDYKDAENVRVERYYVYINDEKHTVSGSASRVEVVYPDGERAYMSYGDNFSAGGGDAIDRDISVDDMREIVFRPDNQEDSSGNFSKFIVALFFIGGGILNIKSPKTAWWLSRGWMYKDAEPSDAYLGFTVFMGWVLLLIAGGLIINVIF